MNEYTGKRLGPYQILEQIGQGGMATIFKAYQPSMDRYVAVKILPRHFTEDETFVARFTQEARTLARLEHPHILPVHDYGEQEGITYLVMRYVDAGTLKELITQQDVLELDEVVRIMEQMGRALSYAHSLGVVHRDIKPSNVLIDERGDVFLTDFGIAKLVAGTSQFTATGAVVGTPAYMSPEQGLGETVDQRSDLYSLGVVLYEMATGRVPFEAETPLAVLLKHVNAPLPPPRQIKPDLPEAVERVILKAMAKSPDDRFETAEEMVEALQRAVAGLPKKSAALGHPTEPDQTVAVPPSYEARAAFPQSRTRAELGEEERAAFLQETVPETEAALPRRSHPLGRNLIPIVGGVAALVAVVIVALLVFSNLGGGEAEATRTPARLGQLPHGWTNYTSGNFVRALARQGDYLWAGGGGGLVRWDLRDGSYVKFGLESELPSSQINDLLMDGDGNLWVATEAGLNRFDGDTWLTFDHADGLDSNEVETLLLDNEGTLWAGTDGGEHGLNIYDGTSWGSPPIPAIPVEFPMVSHLSMERNYGLWASLGEDGLGYFDGSGWSLASEDGLPSDYVYALFLTENDELWVSFYAGVLRRDPETGEWKTIPQLEDKDIYAIHQSRDGRFWFGGDAGAIRYDPATGDWRAFEPRSGGIPDRPITSIVEDEQGLWMGTEGAGVLFYDGEDWETWNTDDGLGGNDVYAIQQDGSGALWFNHPGSGLSRYDPADDAWRTFGENEGAFDWAYYPGVDPNGQLWIGGYDELKWYDGTAWRSTGPEQLAGAGTIFGIAFNPDGVAWLWGENDVIRYDPSTDERTTFTTADHPVLVDVDAIYVASDGTVWAGSEIGLAFYDGGGWSGPDAEGDAPEGDVQAIAEGYEGVLWVVADGALYSLEAGQWSRFDRPDGGWIENLATEPDSSAVWVGYDGLARFDATNNAWQLFTTDDGLVNDAVQAIYVTSDSVVWVGTEAGVSRFVPQE